MTMPGTACYSLLPLPLGVDRTDRDRSVHYTSRVCARRARDQIFKGRDQGSRGAIGSC
jgi:hypothetical protein